MKLNKEQAERIMGIFRSKWASYSCPVCGNRNLQANPVLFQLTEFVPGGGLVIGGGQSIFPITPILCLNCGFTVLINPLFAGLTAKELEPPQVGQQQPPVGLEKKEE